MSGSAHGRILEKTVTELCLKIRSGTWSTNSELASEPKLAKEFGVSRATIRAALAQLEKMGLVTSGQGKRRQVRSEPRIVDFSMNAFGDQVDEDRILGGVFDGITCREVTEIQERLNADDMMRELRLRPSDKVVFFVRVRSTDGIPRALQYVVIPCQTLKEFGFVTNGIEDCIRPQKGLGDHFRPMRDALVDAEVTIRLSPLSDFEATELQMPPDSFTLMEKRTSRCRAPLETKKAKRSGKNELGFEYVVTLLTQWVEIHHRLER